MDIKVLRNVDWVNPSKEDLRNLYTVRVALLIELSNNYRENQEQVSNFIMDDARTMILAVTGMNRDMFDRYIIQAMEDIAEDCGFDEDDDDAMFDMSDEDMETMEELTGDLIEFINTKMRERDELHNEFGSIVNGLQKGEL
jgi:hypothetical protein